MKLLFGLVVLSTITLSCQSHKPEYRYSGRRIASTPILRTFLREVSQSAKLKSTRELEEQVLRYIKSQSKDSNYGNWVQMGISDSQAKKITSLYDDLPHMHKVRKWVTENITKIVKVEQRFAREAYELINKGNLVYKNPYAAKEVTSRIGSNRTSISPFKSIDDKKARVLDNIQNVGNPNASREYRGLLLDFQKRSASEPAIFSNGLEMVESAADITRKTGVKAYGPGCRSFNEKASFEVIEIKANVDAYRANLIAKAAEDKAGKSFKKFTDIPEANRLTSAEIDEATVKSFEDVLGYSNVEAKAAVRRLKRKPCQVY